MDSKDERVAVGMANPLLDCTFGKLGPVKEDEESLEERVANMPREERLRGSSPFPQAILSVFP